LVYDRGNVWLPNTASVLDCKKEKEKRTRKEIYAGLKNQQNKTWLTSMRNQRSAISDQRSAVNGQITRNGTRIVSGVQAKILGNQTRQGHMSVTMIGVHRRENERTSLDKPKSLMRHPSPTKRLFYDPDKTWSIDWLRNSFLELRSAFGKRAITASRAVLH